MDKTERNILVQYDGGGYDGCIWEWNFFYIDQQGKFENIFASGVGGIETQQAAQILLVHNGDDFSSKVYVYHLDNEKDLINFATECNTVHIQNIVRWFNNYNVPDVQPFGICSKCKSHIEDADELHCEDWHGCGGIMSTADTLLCSECWSMGACSYCGEYLGDDSEYLITSVEQIKSEYDLPKNVAQGIIDSYAPICGDCADRLIKRESERMIQKTKT